MRLLSWKFHIACIYASFMRSSLFFKRSGEVWRGKQDKQLNNVNLVHCFIESKTSAMLLIVYKCNSHTVPWTADKTKSISNNTPAKKYAQYMIQPNKNKICVSQAVSENRLSNPLKECAFKISRGWKQFICSNLSLLFFTLSFPCLNRSPLSSLPCELHLTWLHQTVLGWCGSDPTPQWFCAASC